MPPRDFFKEFKPERGDLIYGRTDVRKVYESKLDKDQLKAMADGSWVRIDDYNDSAMIPALQHRRFGRFNEAVDV